MKPVTPYKRCRYLADSQLKRLVIVIQAMMRTNLISDFLLFAEEWSFLVLIILLSNVQI